MRVVPKAHMDASQNQLSDLLTTHAESIFNGSRVKLHKPDGEGRKSDAGTAQSIRSGVSN